MLYGYCKFGAEPKIGYIDFKIGYIDFKIGYIDFEIGYIDFKNWIYIKTFYFNTNRVGEPQNWIHQFALQNKP